MSKKIFLDILLEANYFTPSTHNLIMITKTQAKKSTSYASFLESLEKGVDDSEIKGYIKEAMKRVKAEKLPLFSMPTREGSYTEGKEIIYGDQLFKQAVKMYREAEQEVEKGKSPLKVAKTYLGFLAMIDSIKFYQQAFETSSLKEEVAARRRVQRVQKYLSENKFLNKSPLLDLTNSLKQKADALNEKTRKSIRRTLEEEHGPTALTLKSRK